MQKIDDRPPSSSSSNPYPNPRTDDGNADVVGRQQLHDVLNEIRAELVKEIRTGNDVFHREVEQRSGHG